MEDLYLNPTLYTKDSKKTYPLLQYQVHDNDTSYMGGMHLPQSVTIVYFEY